MFTDFLAQSSANSDAHFFEFLQSLNPDMVGVCMLLTVIGVFGTIIAVSVTLIESRKRIRLAQIQKETVDDLLNRGYALEDIQKLVHGQSGWDKFCGIFNAKSSDVPVDAQTHYRRPVPPNKQPV